MKPTYWNIQIWVIYLFFFPLTYNQQYVSFLFCMGEKELAERSRQKRQPLLSLAGIPACWQVSLWK